jgi:hypothetical protein
MSSADDDTAHCRGFGWHRKMKPEAIMRIVINHDECRHGGAFADRCLAATLDHPLGHERYCTALVEPDGRPELTVTLVMDGHRYTRVFRDRVESLAAAAEGWPAFVNPIPH